MIKKLVKASKKTAVKKSAKKTVKKIAKKIVKKSPIRAVKLENSLINPLRQAARASAARRLVK